MLKAVRGALRSSRGREPAGLGSATKGSRGRSSWIISGIDPWLKRGSGPAGPERSAAAETRAAPEFPAVFAVAVGPGGQVKSRALCAPGGQVSSGSLSKSGIPTTPGIPGTSGVFGVS